VAGLVLVGVGGLALYALVQPPASAGGPAAQEAAAALQPAATPETRAPGDKPAEVAPPEITPVAAEPVAIATDAGHAAPKAATVRTAGRPVRVVRGRTAAPEPPGSAQKKSVQSTITDFGGRR